MLYELLAGSTPLDQATIGQNALLAVLQLIREKEPPRPSTRLSSAKNSSDEISRRRKIAPSKLHSILKGELDWIAMKAIEKDRKRRYESAAGFADDIRRFLDNEAVEARPPSTGYRLQKFVQKNRGLVAAVGTIVAMLTVAVGISSQFATVAMKAKMHAIRAEEVAHASQKEAESLLSETEKAKKGLEHQTCCN